MCTNFVRLQFQKQCNEDQRQEVQLNSHALPAIVGQLWRKTLREKKKKKEKNSDETQTREKTAQPRVQTKEAGEVAS